MKLERETAWSVLDRTARACAKGRRARTRGRRQDDYEYAPEVNLASTVGFAVTRSAIDALLSSAGLPRSRLILTNYGVGLQIEGLTDGEAAG